MVRQLVLNKNGLNLNEIQVEKYNNWFKNYCDSFTDLSGEQRRNFKLKKVHTREVKKNCRLIADTLDLRPIFVKVAEVIGIFHDIGRFEQIKRFNSFSDSASFDHGDFGVKVLKDLQIIQTLDKDTQNVIFSAVKLHNKFRIPVGLDYYIELFVKIIRDADKIDIFRVILEHYGKKPEDRDPSVTLNLKEDAQVSPLVVEKALVGEMVKKEDLVYVNDFKILQAAWIYDFKFSKSMEIVRKNCYVEQLLESLPKSEKIDVLRQKLNGYSLSEKNKKYEQLVVGKNA